MPQPDRCSVKHRPISNFKMTAMRPYLATARNKKSHVHTRPLGDHYDLRVQRRCDNKYKDRRRPIFFLGGGRIGTKLQVRYKTTRRTSTKKFRKIPHSVLRVYRGDAITRKVYGSTHEPTYAGDYTWNRINSTVNRRLIKVAA